MLPNYKFAVGLISFVNLRVLCGLGLSHGQKLRYPAYRVE